MHSESQWRSRAYRTGLRLVKYKQTSSAYQQFGPYALLDPATKTLMAVRLDAEAVERALYSGEEQHSR
jgi:hypothetical protein